MDKPVIMVVDDQSFVCDVIKKILESKYVVKPFTSGKTAVDYLSKQPVDLALLDYDMPNMTGFEVLMAIRSNKRTADMPVIFVTGILNERLEAEMMERGATDYIRKPVQPTELHRCIEKYLN